jgi:hypothetical protein
MTRDGALPYCDNAPHILTARTIRDYPWSDGYLEAAQTVAPEETRYPKDDEQAARSTSDRGRTP